MEDLREPEASSIAYSLKKSHHSSHRFHHSENELGDDEADESGKWKPDYFEHSKPNSPKTDQASILDFKKTNLVCQLL